MTSCTGRSGSATAAPNGRCSCSAWYFWRAATPTGSRTCSTTGCSRAATTRKATRPVTPALLAYAVMAIVGSWVYPLLTVYLPHHDYGDTPLTQTRTLRGHLIPAVFLELTYHLEHHLYPQVPSPRLAELFVATARFTSDARLACYRAETDGVTSAVELVRRLRALYAEDGAEGHIAAVQELIAAANTSARLAEEVRASTAVWQDFAASTISRLIDGTPFAALVPVRELATAAVAAYLGMEMLSHLDIDRTSPTGMFDAAERAAAMFEALRPR